jgi:hypothetical protein
LIVALGPSLSVALVNTAPMSLVLQPAALNALNCHIVCFGTNVNSQAIGYNNVNLNIHPRLQIKAGPLIHTLVHKTSKHNFLFSFGTNSFVKIGIPPMNSSKSCRYSLMKPSDKTIPLPESQDRKNFFQKLLLPHGRNIEDFGRSCYEGYIVFSFCYINTITGKTICPSWSIRVRIVNLWDSVIRLKVFVHSHHQ